VRDFFRLLNNSKLFHVLISGHPFPFYGPMPKHNENFSPHKKGRVADKVLINLFYAATAEVSRSLLHLNDS
jgi:hypothetical protein